MPKEIFINILLFVALVLAQVIVFNNLVLFNVAIAFVFIYLIVGLPITTSTNAVMFTGFLLGLSVDIFQDTPGLNAMACTIIAFIRRPIFHLYAPSDDDLSGRRINIASVGAPTYLKYMFTLTLIYTIIVFTLETLNFFSIERLLIRILASTALTFIVLYSIDSLTTRRRSEKRL